mmetsp:Transcript_18577/g.58744  ORF Transcript_18577/g.58744 Transcript_18577/m.58744 type:complete len:371 (-) Transcript_18577:6-1118(-)
MLRAYAASSLHPPDHRVQLPLGVNVFGHFGGVFGVAFSAMHLYEGLKRHVPVTAIKLVESSVHKYKPVVTSMVPRFACNVVVLNADMAHTLSAMIPWRAWTRTYNIAYWAYELEELPAYAIQAALSFDEIWATSNYTASAIRKTLLRDPATASIPVLGDTIVGIDVPTLQQRDADAEATSRRAFGLPEDAYLFLVCFDCHSVIERKNPIGAIEAFQVAFSHSDDTVRLIVKHMNCGEREHAMMTRQIGNWTSIVLIGGHLSRTSLEALKGTVDCYVSMHRSEGYGLNLLEALLSGKPVIFTRYGGCMDFMAHAPPEVLDNLGVDCKRRTLKQRVGPYPRGGKWCDPKLKSAVNAFRYAYTHSVEVAHVQP